MKRVVDSVVVLNHEHACLRRNPYPDRIVESVDIIADLEPGCLWDDNLLHCNTVDSTNLNRITHEVTLFNDKHDRA